METPRILIIVTSSGTMTSGKPTGLDLKEFSVPYLAFRRAGAVITVASPMGGDAPIDPNSPPTQDQRADWKEAITALKQTEKAATVDPTNYDAVYIPGGHGTMFDFPNNEAIGTILKHFDSTNKVIASICHGPAAFVGAQNTNGQPIVKGRTLNSFTDEEERQVEMVQEMPFLLESKLRDLGANFKSGPAMEEFAIRDENFITGQNPESAEKLAHLVLEAIGAHASTPQK